ncbi:MAG: hypothetical protein UZ09_BCD002002582 [Bacteroidetes bacterium OLB9]|nr:MAG: hypothetical protein UZ09_BCD002002582 [Bacteroidetes bacterium OLB9]
MMVHHIPLNKTMSYKTQNTISLKSYNMRLSLLIRRRFFLFITVSLSNRYILDHSF